MGGHDQRIAERVARNQNRFRQANERIEVAAQKGTDFESVPFLCECPNLDCTEVARLTLAEYEGVRADSRRFLVVPGHEVCEVDGVTVAEVTERNRLYSVLEKIGKAGEVANDLDLRERA